MDLVVEEVRRQVLVIHAGMLGKLCQGSVASTMDSLLTSRIRSYTTCVCGLAGVSLDSLAPYSRQHMVLNKCLIRADVRMSEVVPAHGTSAILHFEARLDRMWLPLPRDTTMLYGVINRFFSCQRLFILSSSHTPWRISCYCPVASRLCETIFSRSQLLPHVCQGT